MTNGQCDARPAVTFPAAEHHRTLAGTKLYYTAMGDRGTYMCVNNLPVVVYLKARGWESNSRPSESQVQRLDHYATRLHYNLSRPRPSLFPALDVTEVKDTKATLYIKLRYYTVN